MNSQSSWPCYFMLLALVCLPANMRAESPDSPPNTAESAAIARTGPQANGSSQQKPLPLAAGPATFGNVPPPMAGPIGPAPGYAPGLAPPAFPPSGIAPASMTAPAGFGPNGAGMGIGLPPNGPPMGFQGPPNAMPMAGPGGMPPQMMGGPGGMPPQMMGGPNGGVMPAAHMGGGAPGPFAQMGAQPMDGPYSPAGYGVRGNFDVLGYLRYLLPYSDGGRCAPRWYDVQFDVMYLKRDEAANSDVIFMSDGPRGLAAPVPALTADDLEFTDREGAPRISIAFQLGPGANIEATYFGLANWASSSSVFDANDGLYSIFSDYGTFPAEQPGVGTIPFGDDPAEQPRLNGGLFSSDAAQFASIGYSSEINSVELMYRRRWVGANCRLQGSWLCGVRYFDLYEDFGHLINVDYEIAENAPPFDVIQGFTTYDISTRNALTGFQLGGDLWANVVPGVRVGGELKAGIYGNHTTQVTRFNFTTISPVANVNANEERVSDNADVAFIGEAGAMATWRVNYNWTIRLGYQAVYIDGVALAVDQFNPVGLNGDPASPPRVPFLNDNGEVFLHGATGGIEYIW